MTFSVEHPNNFFANGYLVLTMNQEILLIIIMEVQNVEDAKVVVTYSTSSEAKIKVDELTGAMEIKGRVQAPDYVGVTASASGISSDNANIGVQLVLVRYV